MKRYIVAHEDYLELITHYHSIVLVDVGYKKILAGVLADRCIYSVEKDGECVGDYTTLKEAIKRYNRIKV